MENPLVIAEYPLERHTSKNSIKKNKKKRITHAQNSYKPKHLRKYYSNKNNNLIQIHSFDYSEKALTKKECQSNNINILDPNYKKNLFEKFSLFLDKKNLNYQIISMPKIRKNFWIKKINIYPKLFYLMKLKMKKIMMIV